MSFIDPAFLFLALPLALAIVHMVDRRFGKQGTYAAVFALSIAVYSPTGLRDVVLLLASVTVNFAVAQSLIATPDERARSRLASLWMGQAWNLAALIWFKYRLALLVLPGAGGASAMPMRIALPLGISFYTFQQAAFLMDAYHRDPAVAAHIGSGGRWSAKIGGWVRYGAFVTFFPQLVIGPISYLRELRPQSESPRFGRLCRRDIVVGLALIGAGWFKKTILADTLGTVVDPVFSGITNGTHVPAPDAWLAVLCNYAQIYFDFSGYSDMALGIGRMFGIRLPINFYSPLKAVGIVDYYRRWHMTLTRVISRFIYTPLSLAGTRWAAARRMPRPLCRVFGLWLPLLVNFEVIALWHGAAATFVVFGLIHGTWYVLETEVRASAGWKAWRKRTPDALRTALGRILVFLPLALTFALFRSESVAAAGRLFSALASPGVHAAYLGSGLYDQKIGMAAIALALIHLAPNSIEIMRRWRPGIMTYANRSYDGIVKLRWRPSWAWTLGWLALVVSSLCLVARRVPFIYQGF